MILQVDGLVVGYGPSVVVQGVSLRVQEGEIVSLIGRNGAGKTTTLRGIMGLTPPRAGTVRLRDRTISGRPPFEIARLGVGYVPDSRRIFPDLTVEENLLLPARLTPRRRDRWTVERVFELFPALAPHRLRRGDSLSGGLQKMLAIGRALMMGPVLILLDEPTEGLAPLVVGQVVEVLGSLRAAGATILLADQNVQFCRRVAQRAYVMEKGMIVAEGSMEAIWHNPEIVARYLAV